MFGAGSTGSTPSRMRYRIHEAVATAGPRGSERIVLAAPDFDLHDGTWVSVSVPDLTTAVELSAALTNETALIYGTTTLDGRPGGLDRVTWPQPVAAGLPCLADLTSAQAPLSHAWLDQLLSCRPCGILLIGPGQSLDDPRITPMVWGSGRFGPTDSPPKAEVRVGLTELRAAVTAKLESVATPPGVASQVSDVLTDADVRGHHSHGVGLLDMYLTRVERGGIDVTAQPVWLRRDGAVRTLDACGGFGQVAANLAAKECVATAARFGLAAVAINNNNHIGMLAAYRQPFIDSGYVGLILNISGPGVAAPRSGRASMGNNAVCLIAPSGDEHHLLVDFATGTVASGKIRDAALRGQPVPPGWLVDRDGRSTTDPAALDDGGAVPVFGDYKGLGVSIIVEVLAGMLAGGTISPSVNKQRQHPELPMGSGQLFLGFDPAAFGSPDLTQLIQQLQAAIRESYGEDVPLVYFPEQQETVRTRDANEHGVSLPASVAAGLGLTTPGPRGPVD